MRWPRLLCPAVVALVALAVAGPARAAAPGWATPHTASAFTVGTYGTGPDAQGVQLFGNGAAQTRTAQMRAIRSDATQGSAVSVSAGAPGFDAPAVAVDAAGRLVVAWTLDTEGPAPIGLAAALGARTGLPRSATVLSTDAGNVDDVAVAIDGAGNGVVAWIEVGSGGAMVKAATLRPGQAPAVVVLTTLSGDAVDYLSVGLDGGGRPTVTWSDAPAAGTPASFGIARGDGTGAFFPTLEQQMTTSPVDALQTFVLSDGSLLALWLEGPLPSGPVTAKTAASPPGGAFGAARTLLSGKPRGGPASLAANAAGRAAVLFPLASGGGTALRVVLRTAGGTWGSARTLGTAGRLVTRANIGVDAKGRVVALWDDGSSQSSGATRLLAARTSSSSDPLDGYNQVAQRSGDKRCNAPSLFLSTSGDGFGSWRCGTSSSGSVSSPRLARLTAP